MNWKDQAGACDVGLLGSKHMRLGCAQRLEFSVRTSSEKTTSAIIPILGKRFTLFYNLSSIFPQDFLGDPEALRVVN